MATKLFLALILSSLALGAPVLEDRQSTTCAAMYAQCGGTGFSGSTCCVSGSVCTYSNAYYSQCLPGTASSSSTSASVVTTSSVASSTTSKSSTTSSSSASVATTSKATTTAASGATTTASYSGNPFSGVQQWANAYYASEISAYAIPSLSAAQATKAAAVAKVPTFEWLYVHLDPSSFLCAPSLTCRFRDTAAKVPTLMAETLGDIRAANKAGASPAFAGLFVVYDLPDRDCAAAASNGEYSIANNGL